MKHQKPFRFKQFEVRHDRCAMKVNTDGVLLGAWADVAGVKNTLDIGTGSGVIALMLAQRGIEAVEAIELDGDAAAQAQENFIASGWAAKLKGYHTAMQQFQPKGTYDLIVSNPPFFENAYKTPLANRNLARHNDTLPLVDLMAFAAQWLTSEGKLALVLPTDMEAAANEAALSQGLHVASICYVKGTIGGETKRVLLSFGRSNEEPTIAHLAIETAPLLYTDEYRALTNDFYLAF
jgi:tRNA1Val (adenine37-N6)-methyltransferase